jgi:uncharacterized protein YqjF (DUF2071 family)
MTARHWSGTLLSLLEAPARQAATLNETEHRPWPLPKNRWIQAQTWEELLFAHWQVDVHAVRAELPPVLEVDTFEGRAYLGVTPFRVANLRPRGVPPVPLLSSFLELNCRTYVSYNGKPGIWFFSLDASSRLAVEAAKRLYKLPYHLARMTGPPAFSSLRVGGGRERAWRSTYEPSGVASPAPAGTLEHFLSERYCLYAVTEDARLQRAEIHHLPWQLQDANAEVLRNSVPPSRLEVSGEPHVMYSARQDVLIWPLEAA